MNSASDQDNSVASSTDQPGKRKRSRRRHKTGMLRIKYPFWYRLMREVTWVIACVLVVVLLRIFIFGVYIIPSESMMPTLDVGDRVLASKLQPKFSGIHRGDIVIFRDPDDWLQAGSYDDYLIKRVIGVAGDKIEADGDGSLTVNGKIIDESSYINPESVSSETTFSVTVKDGFIFVLGDNRANSADSRYHLDDANGGQVPIDKVEAIANVLYLPISRFRLLRRSDFVYANL